MPQRRTRRECFEIVNSTAISGRRRGFRLTCGRDAANVHGCDDCHNLGVAFLLKVASFDDVILIQQTNGGGSEMISLSIIPESYSRSPFRRPAHGAVR